MSRQYKHWCAKQAAFERGWGEGFAYFVPVFLDTPLGPCREGLCDFAPAIAGVAHDLESLFLCGSPRSVSSALLGGPRRSHVRVV